MKLLLLNGNTSVAVTERLAAAARAVARPDTEIQTATATFGAAMIASRAENAIASHAMLTLAAEHAADCDAAVVGVSWDTALYPIRELLPIPVVGMTEAAMLTARMLGTCFGVVAIGRIGLVATNELLALYGMVGQCVGVRAPAGDAAALLTRPDAAVGGFVDAALELVEHQGAEAIILAGAVMVDMPARVQPHLPVPVLEGIRCAIPLAETLARAGYPKPRTGGFATPYGRAVTAVAPALCRMLGAAGPNA